MKRILIFLSIFIPMNMVAQTDDESYTYPYLTLQAADGTYQSLDAKDLTFTFDEEGNLQTNMTGFETFDVSSLSKMFFGTDLYLTLSSDDTEETTKNTARITARDEQSAIVTLNGLTLYKDGDWNSMCLPFDVDLTDTDSPLYGAVAYGLTTAYVSDNVLHLRGLGVKNVSA